MPTTRDMTFDRLTVDHLVRGSTRVSWGVYYQVLDEQPWTFTLQVGETADPDADDWADVGTPVVNAFYAVDDARRDYGTVRTVHYRVKMATPAGTYHSKPAAAFGLLGLHDWLLAREIVRKEHLRDRLITVEGWLLKRRRHGPTIAAEAANDPRTMVVDPLTGDILRRKGAAAEPTKGTEYLGGYYEAMPYALDVANIAALDGVNPSATGNVNDGSILPVGRGLLLPYVSYRDVFVSKQSDMRYEITKVETRGHWKGVPLIGSLSLRLVDFDDIIYTVPVPEA